MSKLTMIRNIDLSNCNILNDMPPIEFLFQNIKSYTFYYIFLYDHLCSDVFYISSGFMISAQILSVSRCYLSVTWHYCEKVKNLIFSLAWDFLSTPIEYKGNGFCSTCNEPIQMRYTPYDWVKSCKTQSQISWSICS